ncbi:cadherin repeat domain-containing protein [Aequorivita flava]|uniref:Cadherin repeat domain-containing protein n=1 Tax=Aequorivita flava TaxID=3114371 RepID=A0AB35YU19_9FLAO
MRYFPKSTFSFLLLISIFILFNSCSSDDETLSTITVNAADFFVTIEERPTAGQVLGTVDGSTSQGSVSFSIIEQSVNGAFEIDASTGELKVVNPDLFNFDTNPIITGTVKVSNGNIFENALVVIYLEDIDDSNVFDGRIWLKTQAELDAFGANNYTHITGQLVIGTRYALEFSDIIDLSPLSSLTSIGENLFIAGNEDLASLNGLQNLKFIGSHLYIFDNPSLSSLAELNKLTTVTMDLNIYQNQSLLNMDGLAIKHIGGILNITSNPSLTNLLGFSELISVGSIQIQSNPQLTNLKGFENITEVSTLRLGGNDALLNLEGLENLTQIHALLAIGACNLLTNLDELQNVHSSPAEITINFNNSLLNINALSNSETVEYIDVSNNPVLVNLQGLENITSANEVYIYLNSSITDLSGLNNLTTVDYLGISQNPNLSSIAGLENLKTVQSSLFIEQNPTLANLNSLNNLETIGNDLRIVENSALTDFCGLQTVIANNGPGNTYSVYGNAYNPTQQDILNGNCSL